MSVAPTISVSTRPRRAWLVAVVVAAAAVLAVVLSLWLTGGSSQAKPAASAIPVSSAAQDARRVPAIMQLTPARLAAGGAGTP